MSNEIQFEAPLLTGETLYAVIARVADGYRWETVTPAFEARNIVNWTDYDIALAETDGEWKGDFPAAIGAGLYDVSIYQQAGGAPAFTDARQGSALMQWDGAAEIPLAAILEDVTGLSGAPMRGTNNAALASVCTEVRLEILDIGTLPATVDLILAGVDVLEADWADGGRLDLLIDALIAGVNVAKISGDTTAAEVLRASQLAYAPDACILVEAGATDVERGTNLAAAYTAACALTPGGEALSRTNRAYVLLPPGGYDVVAATLTLDTQYVDLIATDPQRGGLPRATDVDKTDGTTLLAQFRPPPTVVYSSEVDTTVVEQAAQNVRLTGFAIAQLSGVTSGEYHAFYCSVDNAGSVYDKMYFWHKTVGGGCQPVSFAEHVRGTWRDCIANSYAWRIQHSGEFSAKMYDCYAGSFSFLGDSGSSVGCLLVRCKSIGSDTEGGSSGYGSFSGCNTYGVPIDSDSVFIECESGNRSFGLGKKNEGTFIRCRGGDYCFASTTDDGKPGEFAGYAEDCVAGKGGFGGRKAGVSDNGKCTGTLVRCISRESELPTRLEGATLEGCLLTTGTADQDGVTLLDSGSRVHDSTVLVVEGGTGIPINAGSAQTVSAAGNRYNNRSASETGLGENVTNTGTQAAKLAADGLAAVTTTLAAAPANFQDQMNWLYRRLAHSTFTKTGDGAGKIEVHTSVGVVLSTQIVGESAVAQTVGEPS